MFYDQAGDAEFEFIEHLMERYLRRAIGPRSAERPAGLNQDLIRDR